jgi:hypothetical protein
MPAPSRSRVVEALLERHGTTFAEEAGIRLGDDPTPSPLYRLACLATLISAPIRSGAAVEAGRALAAAGWRTPAALAESTWRQRVTVLNEHGYARYDESTARTLGDAAEFLLDRWGGDLRCLRDEADRDPAIEHRLLRKIKGIGPVGATVFQREVQGAWPEVAPLIDQKALKGAAALGLGSQPSAIADLVPAGRLPHLAAALVRVDLEGTADDVLAAAGS